MSTPALGARRRAACDVRRTAPPKRRKTPRPPPPQKKRAAQTLLDLGQRSLGRRAECARCGLLYVVGDAATSTALDDITTTLAGENAGDEAGRVLTGLGDSDADGYADFLIGSAGRDYSCLLYTSPSPRD